MNGLIKMPFFSIVMPVYNSENSVAKTIDSVLNQDFKNFEFIIVNDGSTDKTLSILKGYSNMDDRILVKTIENSGPGKARNSGIEEASGEFLFLLDADDQLAKDTLSSYYNNLEKDDYDLIISSYLLQVMDKDILLSEKKIGAAYQEIKDHELFLDNIYSLMNKQLMYVVWNKIYKLSIIKEENIRFRNYSSCEDRLFNIDYFHHVENCLVTDKIMYQYSFDGKKSLTNKFLVNKFDTFVEFRRSLLALTLKNKQGTEALFLKGVMSCIIPVHSKDCSLSFKEKINYIKNILNSKDIIEACNDSLTDSSIRKLTKLLFKSKLTLLNYFSSMMMYYLSVLSPRMIEKIKQSF